MPRRPFDHDEALRNVGGSDAILAEMVELFATECPKQMADIEAAYAAGDPVGGDASGAYAERIGVAVRARTQRRPRHDALNSWGAKGSWTNIHEAWAELQRHIGELLQALRTLESAKPEG